jgi:hypothetical protein
MAGILLFGATSVIGYQDRASLSGTWKLDPARSELGQTRKDLVLVIQETEDSISIKETRGQNPKDDVSSFNCETMGQECAMQDGRDKAKVSVYYNGPALVVLKTHGRHGSAVEKYRLSLSPDSKSLVMEISHIEPRSKDEKLVLTKTQ